MPRRKAHGISPAKRASHNNKDDLQARKKAADNNEDPGGGRIPQPPQVVPSAQTTMKAKPSDTIAGPDLNSKYLHKKFKKMATSSPISVGNLLKSAEEAAVNGLKTDFRVLSATEESGMRTSGFETEYFRGSVSPSISLGGTRTERDSSPGIPSVSSASSVPPPGRYVCPYCKLGCTKPSVLQKHIRAHTNERPYPCHPCGFAFKTKSNLYKHCRSRAHTLKMEEEGGSSGVKFNFPSADSSDDIDDDEDENNSNNTPPPSSVLLAGSYNTPTHLPMSSNSSSNTSPCTTMSISGGEANNNQDKPRQIYKPKFHKAALYQEEEEEREQAVAASIKSKLAAQQPSLSLKIPSTSSTQALPLSPSVFGSIRNPTSPSPEFITRHISKIISENQAIVEISDAQWPKKFQQRQSSKEQLREGSPASPLSAASSPGLDGTSLWHKKFFHRQISLGSSAQLENTESEKSRLLATAAAQLSVPSKLALALLRPNRLEAPSSPRTSDSPMSAVSVSTTPEPTTAYQQPLNLSTSHISNKSSCDNSSDSSIFAHRKRSYSESFGVPGATGKGQVQNLTSVLKDHNILSASSNTSLNKHRGQSNPNKFTRLDGAGNAIVLLDATGIKNHTNDKLPLHPQNPEGSIIKDLLLKARAASLVVSKPGGVYSSMADILNPEIVNSLPAVSLSPYLPSTTISQEEAAFTSGSTSQYICSLCNIPYRNAENLEIHQLYYCKGEATIKIPIGSALSPQRSPGIPLNYGSIPNQTLEFHNQGDDCGSSIKGMQNLNVAKEVLKPNKLDIKTSLITSQGKDNNSKGTNLVVPPFPSPGPLLGSTPLVDSYHQIHHHHHQKKKKDETDADEFDEQQQRRGPLPKKRRLDLDISSRDTSSSTSPDIRPLSTTPISGLAIPSTTTLRSLEELSKCPMRSNSLQMFGGEVQILDGAGEMKTMRIEPSSRGSKSPGASGGVADLILSLPNHLHSGNSLVNSSNNRANNETNSESVCGSVSPHIVVTIARSGLHSGGTIVQVPQKSPGASNSSNSGNVKPPRSSGGSINCINVPNSNSSSMQMHKSVQKNSGSSGGMILNSPSHSPLPYSTSALLSSNTNTATNVFSDTSKLLVPIVPNITTPNLGVPGIPAPNLSHYLPFMSCTSILPDGTLLNPLTHITAYNPLTLPPQTNILHSTPHLQNMKLAQPQLKEKKSAGPGANSIPNRENNIPPPYSGGVVTILHGGKEIPYVPGMPGPHTLLSTVPPHVGHKKRASPKPLDLKVIDSPSKESLFSFKVSDSVKSPSVSSRPSTPLITKHPKISSFSISAPRTTAVTCDSAATSSHDELTRISVSNSSSLTGVSVTKLLKTAQPTIPSIKVDCATPNSDLGGDSIASGDESSLRQVAKPNLVRRNSKTTRPDMLITIPGKDSETKLVDEGLTKAGTTVEGINTNKCETDSGNNDDVKVKSGENRPKFLRPTSLPLKPGTFTPKKFHGTGLTPTGMVLSLVSPETPRPKKSYGQLYLNGHAYTYLGLKCSTRAYYCTLNRPQPMYVPQSPEHAKLSMYSNWKVCSEADPNPFGLDPGRAMALYDSRHRPTSYSISKLSERQPNVLTHSSYWLNKVQQQKKDRQKDEDSSAEKTQAEPGIKTEGNENTPGEPPPKRVKIFAGGFESNEEYIYVRGRGRGRYVCEECGIRCKKPSMLKKHIRTHTDVRPFTCKHCNFSFKTKGNLTKHMKSKAHYKKCVELGIEPVPTIVDDSYIDEECLARQQALRDSGHGVGDTDSDENDDEEDEDDDDEDDEEDDSLQIAEDGEDMGGYKGKLEREAACSLLSLSESTRVNTHHHYISAGLIPLTANSGRPNTYPYSLTLSLPGPNSLGSSASAPQTPTLSTVSAQTEREKVSRNTGLALELRSGDDAGYKEEDDRMSSTIRRRGNAPTLVLIPPHGDANRYYFPSCRTPTIATNVPVSTMNRSLSDDKSWTDDGSDSEEYDDRDNSSAPHTDEEDSELSDVERSVLRKTPANIYDRSENIDANLPTNQQPMDLSNKSLPATGTRKLSTSSIPYFSSALSMNSARTPTTPISDILTPVSEPATLIASLCSSMDRFPVTNSMLAQKCLTPDPAETTMLQAYLTERALQDVRMKQHQYQHHHNHHNYTTTSASSSTQETLTKSLLLRRPTPLADVTPKVSPPRCSSLMVSQAAAEPPTVNSQGTGGKFKDADPGVAEQPTETVESKKGLKTTPNLSATDSSEQNIITPEKIKIKESTPVKMQSSGEGIQSKVPMVSISNSVRNVVVGGIAFNTPPPSSPPPSTTNSTGLMQNPSASKPKAEFMPPSSGPSSSYVSVTEDGRSICVICNKIFSKPSQLRLHVNIHYFERPFRCESCAVSFRTKGHLQKHERSVSHQNKVSMNSTFGTPTTTNPRPFKCDDCKVAFRIHGHLAKHLRSKMHIMKLECVGKLPFGTYAEMEREGISLNEIDTTDCENSLESLQVLAQKLYEKDPSKLGQWDGERGELLPPLPHPHLSGGETSSDEGEPLPGCHSPNHQDALTFHVAELNLRLKTQASATLASQQPVHEPESLSHHMTDVKEENPSSSSLKSAANFSYNQDFTERNIFERVSGKTVSHLTSEEVLRGSNKPKSHSNVSYLDQSNTANKERQQYTSSSDHQQSKPSCSTETGYFQRIEINAVGRLPRIPPLDGCVRTLPVCTEDNTVMMSNLQSISHESCPIKMDKGDESMQKKHRNSSEADYEDTSDGDNEGGVKQQFSCAVCHQTFPSMGSLQVHSFVEHDSSADLTEEDVPGSLNPNLGRLVDSNLLNQIRKRSAAGGREVQDTVLRQFYKRSKVDPGVKMLGHFLSKEQSPLSNCMDVSVDRSSSVGNSSLSLQRVQAVDSRDSTVSLGTTFTDTSEKRQIVSSATLQTTFEERIERKECKSTTSLGISDKCKLANDIEAGRDSRRLEMWATDIRQSVDKRLGAYSPKQISLDHRENINSNNQCQTSKLCLVVSSKNENKVQSLEEVGGQNRDESAKNKTSESELDKEALLESRASVSGEECVDVKLNCDLCGKSQPSQESLQKHLLSHAQLRPFVCEFCDAGFISQQQLRSHLALHQQSDSPSSQPQ